MPCQDAHLANRLSEPERNELANTIVGAVPHCRLPHRDTERIAIFVDFLTFCAGRDEDSYVHLSM